MPYFSAFFVLFALSNVGLPGTAGFVGEFMVIVSSFAGSAWVAALAALTVILGAGYTLNMVRRVFYGPITTEGVKGLKDLEGAEWSGLLALAVAILVLGVNPAWLIKPMQGSIERLAHQAVVSKLSV